MTIRSKIGNKKRKAMILGYSGLAFFVLGMIFSDKSTTLPIPPFIGFAIFSLSLLYVFWGIRCPECGHHLAPITTYGSPFSISRKNKYCPFCGIDMDSELEEIK
jgi:hypothetical protein